MSDALTDLLAQQRACLETFRAILESEHQSLLRADVGDLQAVAERKAELFAQIEELESRRVAVFAQNAAADRRPDWSAVRALAEQVAQANQRNGAMIMALLGSTDGALQILRGVAGTGNFYGPQGRPAMGGGASRPLANA